MARVLYLSYDGMTDPLGQSQVLPYLISLSKLGHHIHLISFEKQARANKQATIAQLCHDAGITWLPQHYHHTPPVVSTLYDIRVMQRAAYAAHRKARFDIVHCRSYIAALVGMQLQHRHGLKFLFDMRGFWADERVDGGLWPQSNWLYRAIYQYFKRMERLFLQRANASVSLTHAAKQEIAQWPINAAPITVIPCCADLSHFDPSKVTADAQAAWRGKLKLSATDLVVSYLGSIGTWYLLPEMLQWFKYVLQKKPSAILLFITQEPAQLIWQAAELAGIPPTSLRVQSAERAEVPVLLSLSQLNIFFIKPTFSKKASSPTKQAEVMAMGLPIVCNAGVGDTDRIIADNACGHVVQALNNDAYAKSIAQLDALLAIAPSHIRSTAQRLFALQQGVAAYHRLYTDMMASPTQK